MSSSDNKFGACCGCPALMGGSRELTNHLLNSKMNAHIRNLNNNPNHHQNRAFLQQNANKIMTNERTYFNNNLVCNNGLLAQNSTCNNGTSYPISGNQVSDNAYA